MVPQTRLPPSAEICSGKQAACVEPEWINRPFTVLTVVTELTRLIGVTIIQINLGTSRSLPTRVFLRGTQACERSTGSPGQNTPDLASNTERRRLIYSRLRCENLAARDESYPLDRVCWTRRPVYVGRFACPRPPKLMPGSHWEGTDSRSAEAGMSFMVQRPCPRDCWDGNGRGTHGFLPSGSE